MPDIAIFGAAGAVGHAVGAELDRRGIPFRVCGRTRSKLIEGFPNAEAVETDLSLPASAALAARGCFAVVYAVGVPYTRFELHPVLMRNTIEAALAERVKRLIVISSVYSYGIPRTPRVAEDHPREPETHKGRMRKAQEDLALNTHREGRIESLVLHLPDFYGPYADLSISNPIFEHARDDKRSTWLGSPELPHEILFVPDAGPVIVNLAFCDGVWGERWNMGGAVTTGREFMTAVYRAAGREPKWRSVRRPLLRLAGLFSPFLREVGEMYYLQKTPVILDDSKLRERLGDVPRTSLAEGIRMTTDWVRHRH